MGSAVAGRIAERIHREGPIPYDAFVDEALYGDGGFFARARGAGRSGSDFVTSPEVGPLFGALVARALDRWWDDLGRPDPFFVVEAGAGRGRLAADVLGSEPRCGPALRYVLVERSGALRSAQRDLVVLEPFENALGPTVAGGAAGESAAVADVGPIATSLGDMPAVPLTGVVLANELLDNLAFRVVERAARGWFEVRVGLVGDSFEEELVPAAPDLASDADRVASGNVPVGARLPVPTGARDWLQSCALTLQRGGVLVVIDYVATATELVERSASGWQRTYREHRRGASPLVAPGEQDITADVPYEYLVHAARGAGFTLQVASTQAEWLRGLGVEELVADARAGWNARAHVGDLEAVRHRSRVTEAAALLEPSGLGGHRVLVFRAG